MKGIVTGVTYLDGFQYIGTVLTDSGVLSVLWPESLSGQRVALFDMIEMTGETMVSSPHHGGMPAFSICAVKVLQKATLGILLQCNRETLEGMTDVELLPELMSLGLSKTDALNEIAVEAARVSECHWLEQHVGLIPPEMLWGGKS